MSENDPAEVAAILKEFEQRLIRHADDGDVTERAFLAKLSMQFMNSSQASNSKNKKPWKNKKRKRFVKSKENTKESCKTCGNLHYGECWSHCQELQE